MTRMFGRFREVVVHRILGIDDTPHRIAYGVFLGWMIGWTPTMGLQVLIYAVAATLLRANKFSGVPVVFIANPLTAVPLYYTTWRVGAWVLHSAKDPAAIQSALATLTGSAPNPADNHGVFSAAFWQTIGTLVQDVGAELWMGALVLGLLTGLPSYFLTYYAVIGFRRTKEEKRLRNSIPPPAPSVPDSEAQ